MDARLYLLAGLAFLFALLVLYVFIAFVRYGRAVRGARRLPQPTDGPVEREAYLGSAVEDTDDVFSVRAAGPPPSPRLPGYGGPVAPAVTTRTVTAEFIPEVHRSGAVRQAAIEPTWEPRQEPAPEPVLEPALAPEPEPMLEPAREHVPDPVPAPEPVLEPVSESEPMPTPPVASEPAAVQTVQSLADELERLMASGTAEPALLTAEEHARIVPGSGTQPTEIPIAFEPTPLLPSLSVGTVLSAPQPRPQPDPQPHGSVPAPPELLPEVPVEPAPRTGDTPKAADAVGPAAADSPYVLVAPVELHFTGSVGRVGVKSGTRTYDEFQRLAGILLGDLRRARGW
ncbi:MAG: hypothetical protein JXP37_07240 [Coriobacteriia bacterium]|nr:hypothetical protein [Coriobacteriia bacterium]